MSDKNVYNNVRKYNNSLDVYSNTYVYARILITQDIIVLLFDFNIKRDNSIDLSIKKQYEDDLIINRYNDNNLNFTINTNSILNINKNLDFDLNLI